MRLELMTPPLPWACSTTELTRQFGGAYETQTHDLFNAIEAL